MKPRKGFTPVAGVGSLTPADAIVLLKREAEQATLDTLLWVETDPLPNSITVLQIEHIGLEFNIELFPFTASLRDPCGPAAVGGHEEVNGGVVSLS